MKFSITHIDKVALPLVLLLLFGSVSAYLNFGSISVIASVILPILFLLNLFVSVYALKKKKYLYLTGIVLFLFAFSFFYQFSLNKNEDDKDSISLLSYNVRAFNNEDMKISSKIIRFIDSINPDILLLQESTYKVGRNIGGYDYHFLGYRKDVDKTLLDIYSKFPIVDKGYIDFPESKNNAIYTDLKVNNVTIRVYNLHLQSYAFTSGKNEGISEKLKTTLNMQVEQSEIVKSHANASNQAIAICGDFNATQFSLPYKILKKGLNDTFVSNGNGLGTTYNLSGYPLRLDYVLTDESLNILSHNNFNINLSDHEPILIKFKIPKMLKS